MSIPLSGNIKDTPLPDILESLYRKKATGTLTVQVNGVEKAVFIKEGLIIFSTSTDNQDRLGEMLVKAGKLKRENLDAALGLLKKSGGFKKLGAILVEKGFVAPKDLFEALKSQVKEIIYSLFLWEDAEYRFDEILPSDVIQLQINIEELIRDIIQRIRQEAQP